MYYPHFFCVFSLYMCDVEINDTRAVGEFKGVTFSKYKKTAAKKELIKCLSAKKIESACYWSAELICAGHYTELWESIIQFSAKNIHIGNPRLPIYIAMRFDNFKTIVENGYASDELRLRNNANIRNIFGEIIATLCYSSMKHSIEAVKINKLEEFNMSHMACRLKAPSVDFGKQIFRATDPRELYVAVNELAYHIGDDTRNTVDACYWIEWVLEYETLCRKRREKCGCERRTFARVQDKYQMDIVWLVWDVLLNETQRRKNPLTDKIIQALLTLYCVRYTSGSKKRRRFVLYFGVSLLTETYDPNRVIVSNKDLVDKVVKGIDVVYKDVKKNEEAPATEYLSVSGQKTNLDRTVERLEKLDQLLNA